MAILEVQGLSKSYRQASGETTVAIDNITCQVEAGEFVSFVGPSGCGKTTLLMSIAGLLAPTSGRVIVNGNSVAGPPANWVLLFQEYNKSLFAWRSVLGNVRFGLEARRGHSAGAEEKAKGLIELVGLKGFESHYPWELSGGMQQRASIARALVHDPKLILMDEPFGALDALTREKMNLELLRIWEEAKQTIIFVTHGITEAVFLGSRVVVLTSGPARMADNFMVDIPHPRTLDVRNTEKFGEYTRRIYRLLGIE